MRQTGGFSNPSRLGAPSRNGHASHGGGRGCRGWTRAALALVLALCAAFPGVARAEDDWTIDQGYYTVNGPEGVLFLHNGELDVGDEYISADNKAYRVFQVDPSAKTATAEYIGDEALPELAFASADMVLDDLDLPASSKSDGGRKLIAMYCTHSDESYIDGDGVASKDKRGGIFDVAEALAGNLQAEGVEVKMDESNHYPHDSGAYRRSRATAAQLMKSMPAALIDVHRDGVPADQYVTKVDGEHMTKVRLFVGRSNPNKAANRQFATQLKAVADKKYPGLIKDIFIGKGNYNQELMPRAILLEFGTHESNKEQVLASTTAMSDVLTTTLFGTSFSDTKNQKQQGASATDAAGAKTQTKSSGGSSSATMQPEVEQQSARSAKSGSGTGTSAFVWVVGVLLVIGGITLAATGGKGFWNKLARNTSEVTGGLVGKREDDDDRPK